MTGCGSSARYEIRVGGVLDPSWFPGMEVEVDRGQTVITGRLADQSALHGLLDRIRDLGLCLISLRRQRLDDPRPAST